jgi:uncharacterized protein (DUF2141 family)
MLKILAALSTLSAGIISMPAAAQQDEENSGSKLILQLSNLRNRQGQFCVSVFADEKGFPADGLKSVYSKCHLASELIEPVEIEIQGLQPGNYALAMFHDENSDKQLNTGTFGIPLEGFGFSNNPKILFSAPKFAECSFAVIESRQTVVQVRANYFL